MVEADHESDYWQGYLDAAIADEEEERRQLAFEEARFRSEWEEYENMIFSQHSKESH